MHGVPRVAGSGTSDVFASGTALDGVHGGLPPSFIFYLFPCREPPGEPLHQEIKIINNSSGVGKTSEKSKSKKRRAAHKTSEKSKE